jgi:ankyrin repeat protein
MDPAGRVPLHYAALEDNAQAIARLVGEGTSVDVGDRQGFTPLHLAAQQFALHAADSLIAAGATIDAENAFGNTPLFIAVFNSQGRGDLIQLLRSHGADPRHVNRSGQSPVGLARLIANYNVAKYFEDVPED